MKKFICLMSIVICLAVFCISPADAGHGPKGKLYKIVKSLGKNAPVKLVTSQCTQDWQWAELAVMDEPYPLTVDILENRCQKSQRIAFLVAPSGYNFRNNYFAPRDKNLAHFLREKGYLVVGITFREDRLPPEQADETVAAWGIEKHVADMHKIIKAVRKAVRKPYDLMGQSSAAICIMDYAANYSHRRFEKIVLLDTDSFDPDILPEKLAYAGMTYDAMVQLMNQGMLVDGFAAEFKELMLGASLFPDMDSGRPRPAGLPGNFTLNGLLHFSLVNTAFLPGLTTPITGLPGEWVMIQGVCNGYYNFDLDPLMDDFALTKTDAQVFQAVAADIGFGSTPLALARDAYGLLALNSAYTIDWAGIEESVVMVNGALSSGDQTYYGTLIENAGNDDVTITVIPGYGYADLLWGIHADEDVWPYLIDEP